MLVGMCNEVGVSGSPPSVPKVEFPKKVELPTKVKLPPVLSLVAAEMGARVDSNSDSAATKLMAYTIPTPIAEYKIALSATTSNTAAVSLRIISMLGSKRSGASSVFASIFVFPALPPIWARVWMADAGVTAFLRIDVDEGTAGISSLSRGYQF